MRRVLEPFKDATEAFEGDYIALTLVPCIMSGGFPHRDGDCFLRLRQSSANATEVMLLDHTDRWDELPNVKIAATSAHAPKASSALTRRKRLCSATLISRSVRSCSKRTSPRKCRRERVQQNRRSQGKRCGRGRGNQEEAVEEMIFEEVCGDGEGSRCGGR